MKHTLKATIIVLAMFVVTQLIGLYVINHYLQPGNILPFGLEPPEIEPAYALPNILVAFVFAILLFLLISKFKLEVVMRIWFFSVVTIALSISLLSVFYPLKYALIIVLVLSLVLAAIKIFQRNFLVHNFTELLIYPGIAVLFVPLLTLWTAVVLLLLLSAYDVWAVRHSGIMMKMASFQINKVKIFAGFFVPYASKKVRSQIRIWKKTLSKPKLRKKKVRVNVAILGGGDSAFPLIAAGVVLKTLGLSYALFVIGGAVLGLSYILFTGEMKKPHPALPYITAGILLALGLSYLIL